MLCFFIKYDGNSVKNMTVSKGQYLTWVGPLVNVGHISSDMDSDIQWYENGMKKFVSNLNGDIYSENDRKSWAKCTDFYLSEIIDFFQTTPKPPPKGGATTEMEIYLFAQSVITGIIFRFGIIMDLIQEVNEELLSGPLDPSVSISITYFTMS